MYDAKNTSTAHTQTAAQNQLIMAAKVAYDVHFITALLTGISVTPTFAYGEPSCLDSRAQVLPLVSGRGPALPKSMPAVPWAVRLGRGIPVGIGLVQGAH